MTPTQFFNPETDRPKLVLSRRQIAAGIAALMGVPASSVAGELQKLTRIPMDFDPKSFSGMMKNGVFTPDYRFPMSRIVFKDGTACGWQRYALCGMKPPSGKWRNYDWTRPLAIEICAPDKNGMPRFAQLEIA